MKQKAEKQLSVFCLLLLFLERIWTQLDAVCINTLCPICSAHKQKKDKLWLYRELTWWYYLQGAGASNN